MDPVSGSDADGGSGTPYGALGCAIPGANSMAGYGALGSATPGGNSTVGFGVDNTASGLGLLNLVLLSSSAGFMSLPFAPFPLAWPGAKYDLRKLISTGRVDCNERLPRLSTTISPQADEIK